MFHLSNFQSQTICDKSNFTVKAAMNSVVDFVSFVTSLCDVEEDVVYRTGADPSQPLTQGPRGIFATSFEKIPHDVPIEPLKYRTGHRYIQADNFPQDEDLDEYLLKTKKTSPLLRRGLDRDASDNLFCLASEDELEFKLLSQELSLMFSEMNEHQKDALATAYPLQADFLCREEMSTELVENFFTMTNGEEDLTSLEEMCSFMTKIMANQLQRDESFSELLCEARSSARVQDEAFLRRAPVSEACGTPCFTPTERKSCIIERSSFFVSF